MHESRACLTTTHWASIRDVFVTCLTYDHRFALASGHEHHRTHRYPPGAFPLALTLYSKYAPVDR
jgi:hypothetical protein